MMLAKMQNTLVLFVFCFITLATATLGPNDQKRPTKSFEVFS